MMRDEVIEHLKETADYFRECRMNASFASKDENHFWEMQNAANELIGLLKEQEPVEPKVSSAEQRCGNCNKVIEMDGWVACPWCGKPIAWSEWWNKNGRAGRKEGVTNQLWLATISPEEWLNKIYWLYHIYGKRFDNTRLAVKEWLIQEHEEEVNAKGEDESGLDLAGAADSIYCLDHQNDVGGKRWR